MLPIKALKKTRSTPYVTYGLILANALVFAWELSLGSQLGAIFLSQAYNPCSASFSLDTLWDLTRTMFFHGGWLHIFGNMLFLWVFGPAVEDFLGGWRYLLFYLLVGYMASLTHGLISNVCGPTVGASGAIFGVMGAFLLLYPAARIRSLVLFFRIPIGVTNVQAFYMLLAFFAIDFFNGLASLGPFTVNTGSVALWAHIGGFLAGLLLTFTLLLFNPAPDVDPLEHLEF
jgi:membrane associated rhomboid family serine protease